MVQTETYAVGFVSALVVHWIHSFSDWLNPAAPEDPLTLCVQELAATRRAATVSVWPGRFCLVVVLAGVLCLAIAIQPTLRLVKRVTIEIVTAARDVEPSSSVQFEEVDVDLVNYVPCR